MILAERLCIIWKTLSGRKTSESGSADVELERHLVIEFGLKKGIGGNFRAISIRGVNQSRKFRASEKVQVQFGLQSLAFIFLDNFWTEHKLKQGSHISRPYSFMNHHSVTGIVTCISLCPSVTVRVHLTCRERFINIMFNEIFSNRFWTPKQLDIFRSAFWVSIRLRIGHNLKNVRILHL